MKQIVNVVRRVNSQNRELLFRLELDYQLASLYSAMQANDEQEVKKIKSRLTEIQLELKLLQWRKLTSL